MLAAILLKQPKCYIAEYCITCSTNATRPFVGGVCDVIQQVDTLDCTSAASSEQKAAAQRFLNAVQTISKDGLTADEELAVAELESGKYKANISRELDL